MKSGFVALVGRPNAGKSTLLNALVETKVAIVSDKPQTTRTRILGVKTTPMAQMVFVDTPGVHRPLHRLNVRMVDTALDALRSLDVVVVVVDASEATGKGTEFLLELLKDVRQPVVLALNKIDLIAKPDLLPKMAWFQARFAFADIVPIGARAGDGVAALEAIIVRHLADGEPAFPEDYLTDQPERRIAAELVREQVLAVTNDELPFSTAVTIDQFEEVATGRPTGRPKAGQEIVEGERDLLRIACSILVDRSSQKPILIGKGGEMIKRIGTAARLEIQKFFGTRVFLDLMVKVAPDWRENERVLDDLGIPGRPKERRASADAPLHDAATVNRPGDPDWIYNTAAKRGGPWRAPRRGNAQHSTADSMPLHTTDALILRTYKLNDADRIVVFLTRDRGKKRGVAKGARRLKSRFRGALEPLTRASVVYFEKESRELVSLNDADAEQSPLAAFHPEALGYVGYLAELIDEWAPENDPNEKLFRLGAAVLEALAADVPVDALVRYFEFWLLRLQGVYPSVTTCQRCHGSLADGARLSPAARTLVCRHCAPPAGASPLSPGALGFLRAAATLAPLRLKDAPLSLTAERELAVVHRALITWHLEKDLRSARVLREMRHAEPH